MYTDTPTLLCTHSSLVLNDVNSLHRSHSTRIISNRRKVITILWEMHAQFLVGDFLSASGLG